MKHKKTLETFQAEQPHEHTQTTPQPAHLVVAALLHGQRVVCLHADERQVGGGADQGAHATGSQTGQGLLPQGDVGAAVHVAQGGRKVVEQAQAGGGVGRLAQQAGAQALVQSTHTVSGGNLARHGQLWGRN